MSSAYEDGQKPAGYGTAVCLGFAEEETTDQEIVAEIAQICSSSSVGKSIVLGRGTEKFLFDAVDELYQKMISTVSLFRWRSGLAQGPPNAVRNQHGYFSLAPAAWHKLTLVRGAYISFGLSRGPMPAAELISKEVSELVMKGVEEPLGRQLFREAWTQRSERPRSALVIGVAAAEVGFKKLVGTLVPETQWLMDEIQSPPLGQMLRKFLPLLLVKRGFDKSLNSTLIKQLEEAVRVRNKIVHAGEPPPDRDELDKMLRAVNDFLWICDLYSGETWVAQYIPSTALQA